MAIEKVNPDHPDKLADRIAGALVDLAYSKQANPRVAYEVLIGHQWVYIIGETSLHIDPDEVRKIVERITKTCRNDLLIKYTEVPQDTALADNQINTIKAGDNGIFKGVPVRTEVKDLSKIVRVLYRQFPSDGKYILSDDHLIICQSNATEGQLSEAAKKLGDYRLTINPLGDWTGGYTVDTGAINRKLGSDMGEAVTGGGLHGKDLSKADVSINIYAHLRAQELNKEVSLYCAIGDEMIDGKPYQEIVGIAEEYINGLGGFEKLAEWGLV